MSDTKKNIVTAGYSNVNNGTVEGEGKAIMLTGGRLYSAA